jgi:Na+-driven multidrug efflux pump
MDAHKDSGAIVFNEKSTKKLLFVTAVIEILTGLMLVVLPSTIGSLLLGSNFDTPVSLTVARVAGVALIALGIACWTTNNNYKNDTARGLVIAMTFHNIGIFIVLIYAGTQLGLSGIGLWPAILTHLAMAFWCLLGLFYRPKQ